MTSELRPAVEVLFDTLAKWDDCSDWDYVTRYREAAAVIEADREAVRAEQAAEIVKERERADKFMWQVRDTCARAERAEQELAKYKALAETLAWALGEAVTWNSHDDEGVAAVWLDQANEALRQYKEATNV